MNRLAPYLAQHLFKDLFIQALGWDDASGTVELPLGGRAFSFSIVAQKRGLPVLHGTVDNFTLVNRARLRRLQRRLMSLVHEHIVIYSGDCPRRQVWQLAVRLNDDRRHRLRYREHPFFSERPPAGLLERLDGLRFMPCEEQEVTLSDVLGRICAALDGEADRKTFFVKSARRAQQEMDLLARAVETDGAAELQEFILSHRQLVTWVAHRYRRLYGGSVEDAEQAGMLGLIYATFHYQPRRGFQFVTYATRCIQGFCKRDAMLWSCPIHIPNHVVWRCREFGRTLERVYAAGGPRTVNLYLADSAGCDARLAEEWPQYERAIGIRSLSQRHEPEYRESRNLPAPQPGPLVALCGREQEPILRKAVRKALGKLSKGDADAVRLRYGLIGGYEYSLDEIGSICGVTREAIRQRLVRACAKLAPLLAALYRTVRRGTQRTTLTANHRTGAPARPTMAGKTAWNEQCNSECIEERYGCLPMDPPCGGFFCFVASVAGYGGMGTQRGVRKNIDRTGSFGVPVAAKTRCEYARKGLLVPSSFASCPAEQGHPRVSRPLH